jgi:hypothetical protein
MCQSILTNTLWQTLDLIAFFRNINYHSIQTSAIRQTYISSDLIALGINLMYHSNLANDFRPKFLGRHTCTSYLTTLGRRLMYHSMLTHVHWLSYLYK